MHHRHPGAIWVPWAFGAAALLGCGGSISPRTSEVDSGAPGATGPEASASSGASADAGAGSCPATREELGATSCSSAAPSCSYDNQFVCFCAGSSWECTAASCLCESGDGGCVNKACSSDADCPSGQHCGVNLGSPETVCSVGCAGGLTCPAGSKCQMFAP